ncbi:MAG TPA: hypothetical protein PK313_16470, partial [Myxococcota bacterium]|nr:hypothetical protein [Myxococcota bacterium]
MPAFEIGGCPRSSPPAAAPLLTVRRFLLYCRPARRHARRGCTVFTGLIETTGTIVQAAPDRGGLSLAV